MFKEIIEKYFKRKHDIKTSSPQSVSSNLDFDITILKNNHIFKVEISDYVTIVDYVERMKEIDRFNLLDLICNAVLWSGKRQKVNKGSYFVIMHNNCLYNVFLGEDKIGIDERFKVGEETHERIIFIDTIGEYHYTSFKHDKTGSTFYSKYYSKNGFCIPAMQLSKEEAYRGISEVLSNIELVPGIEDVIDVNSFRTSILDDMVPQSDGVNKLNKV